MLNHFQKLTGGFAVGAEYGLGLMRGLAFMATNRQYNTTVVGHGGEDFGSAVNFNQYAPEFDFTMNMATNGAPITSLNCSAIGSQSSRFVIDCAFCLMVHAKNASAWPGACPCSLGDESTAATTAATTASAIGTAKYHHPLAAPAALLAGGAPKNIFCKGAASCVGASANLTADDCLAWRTFYLTLGGAGWSHCADAVFDPCGCAGHSGHRFVKCVQDVGGQQHITEIVLPNATLSGGLDGGGGLDVHGIGTFAHLERLDLSQNHLYGGVPQALANLTKLQHMNLRGNLLSGTLPDLGFGLTPEQGGFIMCDLRDNDFDCPLPPSATTACSGMHSGDVLACDGGAPVSDACRASTNKLWSDASVHGMFVGLFSAANKETQQAVNLCEHAFLTLWACNQTVDWSAHEQQVQAARAAAQAVDAGADVCFNVEQTELNCGTPGRPCVETVQKVKPLFFGANCTAEDRDITAAYGARTSQCVRDHPTAIAGSCNYSVYQRARCQGQH